MAGMHATERLVHFKVQKPKKHISQRSLTRPITIAVYELWLNFTCQSNRMNSAEVHSIL